MALNQSKQNQTIKEPQYIRQNHFVVMFYITYKQKAQLYLNMNTG